MALYAQAEDLLQKALKGQKLAHAYLFCGGRGTGKTSVARILAKDVGCNPEDIIEIDAASNRGIDEIRELREAVRSLPFSSPYKVYIVDEVHMLTKEAANALLKTLEEPPKHVIFILATTDPDKLPQTIVSRCQKIEFKQPTVEVLSGELISIAKKEGKTLAVDASLLIATHGKGSYRDAFGVLEQVITRTDGKSISLDTVTELLGVPSEKVLLSLIEAMCNKDALALTKELRDAKSKNISAIILYKDLIEYLRLALLARVGADSLAHHTLLDVQEKLKVLGTTYPLIINSQHILAILDGEKYLRLPSVDAYISLEMIILATFEK
jgi:DNA polymerase-3 subunit gamma/tau